VQTGAAIIAIGATLLVDNGTIIAERLGVPSSVIALKFVALGTSLPALFRGKLARWQGIALLGIYVAFCVFQFAF